MRCTLITYALDHGLQVIGQVRRDTALFHQPERTGKRGHPRKYGERVSAAWIDFLPEVSMECFIYGKTQMVYYRSAIVLARFLKGRAVRDPKSGKFGPKKWPIEDEYHPKRGKAA